MKAIIIGMCALSVLAAQPSFAQRNDRDNDRNERFDRDRDRDRDRDDWRRPRWERGDRVPPQFRGNRYVVSDWRRAHLSPPPRGHRWVMVDDNYYLTRGGWVVVDIRSAGIYAPPPPPPPPKFPDNREDRWRARYGHAYTVQNDPTYTQCKRQVDPAGAIVGAVLGGLLGNAAGGRRDKTGATVAGVIAGGAIGAALTAKMDCEDRGYAYRSYNEGFNSGRKGADFEWRNPDNGNRGKLHVIDYYKDEDDFRCSVYSQEVWIGGRREEARGRACQQPDGSWAMID